VLAPESMSLELSLATQPRFLQFWKCAHSIFKTEMLVVGVLQFPSASLRAPIRDFRSADDGDRYTLLTHTCIRFDEVLR
jgi:hypothetical protein